MKNPDLLGCPHFSLRELCHSAIAARRGIENRPGRAALSNLIRLARALEVIRREAAGESPLIVSSGYRCPELNAAVGGAADSNHLYGLACDFHSSTIPASVLFDRIRRAAQLLEWDECLWEIHGATEWIHFAVCPPGLTPLQKTLIGVRDPTTGRMGWRDPQPLKEQV